MSGGPSWASTEWSANSTKLWTIDWGWTITSIFSPGRSKSQCASMISRALLTMVAESMVILAPIDQFG